MTKHEFTVGDLARSIESGWLGRIIEILPTETSEFDGRTCRETMCKMEGFDMLAWTVAGGDLFDHCDHDDAQWFSLNDIRYVRVIEKEAAV